MPHTVLIPREEAISRVCEVLGFPWRLGRKEFGIESCLNKTAACEVRANTCSPLWNRSTRDGFAVHSVDTGGASSGAPVFLSRVGEVKMGEVPDFSLERGTCCVIHTGGISPKGSDAVLMLEDAADAAGFVEARRAVQAGENVILKGEEYNDGDVLIHAGEKINFSKIGTLASMGISKIKISAPRVGVLSTGDEIVEIDDFSSSFSEGKVRDVNSWVVSALLEQSGYDAKRFGIVGDDKNALNEKVSQMLAECDVVLLSGGSSVSVRDHTESILSSLPSPGLIVKGIRIVPGKPTLIAGDMQNKKLAIGLPGHPLSCLTVMITVVLPILNAMLTGEKNSAGIGRKLRLRTRSDVFGRTGVEEFVPCRIENNEVVAMPSKSGYIGVMASGFIRLPDNVETVRAGEEVEVWLW